MSFLGFIGKRFKESGLQESTTTAVRAHKLMSEALQQMRLDAFLQFLSDEEVDEIRTVKY